MNIKCLNRTLRTNKSTHGEQMETEYDNGTNECPVFVTVKKSQLIGRQ